MRKRFALSLLTIALALTGAEAHDMFLILPAGGAQPESEIEAPLFNGTIDKSENTIERDRMQDVTVVDAEGWADHPPTESWRDDGDTSVLTVETGPPGTLLVGVSTRPRLIELSAEDFNEYLRHDGVRDVLDDRTRDGELDRPAREWYSKHVKTLIQVGGESSDTWQHRLGYPVELVPMDDPAGLAPGDTLQVLVLADGEPLAGQLVYASYEGYHAHDEDDGTHREAFEDRSDMNGIVRLDVTRSGRWYLRLIHMVPSDEEGLDYESNWATLTFEVS